MDLTQSFVDFANLGSEWVLWLLIALSVTSIAVMVDRALWFRGRDVDTLAAATELRAAFADGSHAELARRWLASTAIPLQVAARGLEAAGQGAAAAAEAMHSERARWRRIADRNVIVLGTLGNNVPFVGLFGTVLGVIKLRITHPDLPRPYRAWGYPVTPVVFLLVTGFMMYYLFTERPLHSALGILIMLSGLLIYAVFRKREGQGPVTAAAGRE